MVQKPIIHSALVRALVDAQFPCWAALPIQPLSSGVDNRMFRLGRDLVVRLPSAEAYAGQVEKEQSWLPVLACQVPLPIPKPVAMGRPGAAYPWNWSIYEWIDGETAGAVGIGEELLFARSLAAFLRALHAVDPAGGPRSGRHNGFRGDPLDRYDAETRRAVELLGDVIDGDAAIRAWEASLAAPFEGPVAWLHGDVSAGNLLVRQGCLSAVIDFGCCAVGDPACDFAIAWSLFDAETRGVFREAAGVDPGTWVRGRGWALWKALVSWAKFPGNDVPESSCRFTVEQVLADFASAGERSGAGR